jgi:hypothetical protein
VLLVVVAVGLSVFFSNRKTASASEDDDDNGSVSSSDADPQKRRPTGGLRDNVPSKVAGYRVDKAKPLQIPGAIDAVSVSYKKGTRELLHVLAVYPSEAASEAGLEDSKRTFDEKRSDSARTVTIRDKKGTPIGRAYRYPDEPEILAYKVGKLHGAVLGPKGDVREFFQALP